MTLDTRTDAEKRYDATRLSPLPAAEPELPPDIPLSPEEIALMAIVLGPQAPPAIDATLLARARGWALAEWEGTSRYDDDGQLHRSPDLPAQPIAALPDGSAVFGSFDTDDAPFTVHAEIGALEFTACDQVLSIRSEDGYIELTHAQAAALRDIAASGALDQIMRAAIAWVGLNDAD